MANISDNSVICPAIIIAKSQIIHSSIQGLTEQKTILSVWTHVDTGSFSNVLNFSFSECLPSPVLMSNLEPAPLKDILSEKKIRIRAKTLHVHVLYFLGTDKRLGVLIIQSLSVDLCICLLNTVMILSFWIDMAVQTVQTQIRLLLEEQSDQGLQCLPFRLHRLDSFLYGTAK